MIWLFPCSYQHSLAAGYNRYNTPVLRSDKVPVTKEETRTDDQPCGEKIGSPVHSDEGILTKASSQDDLPPSISPPGGRPFLVPKFRRSDSEEQVISLWKPCVWLQVNWFRV